MMVVKGGRGRECRKRRGRGGRCWIAGHSLYRRIMVVGEGIKGGTAGGRGMVVFAANS